MPLIAIAYQSLFGEMEVFAHLWRTVLPDYLSNTFALVLVVGIGSLVVGVPLAWLTAMCDFPGRKLFLWALMLPLAMPSYVVAYVYTDLLEYAGPVQRALRDTFGWQGRDDYWFFEVRSLEGAGVMLALVLYPYVYLLARTAFLEQSVNLIHSSRMLGCNAWQSFWRISLPLARPAIAVALALIAMETLADFATVNYFAVQTLTTAVYDTWLGLGSLSAAAKLSALMLLFVFVLVGLERFGRRKQQLYQQSMGQEHQLEYRLTGLRGWIATLACTLVFVAAFALPFGQLVIFAAQYFSESWTPEFWQYSLNSLILALTVSVGCVVIGVLLSYFKRLSPARGAQVPAKIASTGYALPGTVLAIGVLIPLTAADHGLNNLMEWLGTEGPGLLFSGSLMAIVFAYIVRFSAIAIGSIESSLNKVAPSLDMVSVTLGLSPLKMLVTVHLPLIRKGCIAGALLVFIESMKELPAALLLRPFNYETLATYVYQFVSDEQLEHGALAAIVIVLLGLVPLLFLNRSLEQQH